MITIEEINDVKYFELVNEERLVDVFDHIRSFLNEVAFIKSEVKLDLTRVRNSNDSIYGHITNISDDKQALDLKFIYNRDFVNYMLNASIIKVYYHYELDKFTIYRDNKTTGSINYKLNLSGTGKQSELIRTITSVYPIDETKLDDLFKLSVKNIASSFKSKYIKDMNSIINENNYNKLYLKLKKDPSLVSMFGEFAAAKVAMNSSLNMSIKAAVIERFDFASKLISETSLSDSQLFQLIDLTYKVNKYLQKDYTLNDLYVSPLDYYGNKNQINKCLKITAGNLSKYYSDDFLYVKTSSFGNVSTIIYSFLIFGDQSNETIDILCDSLIEMYKKNCDIKNTNDYIVTKNQLLTCIKDNAKDDFKRSVFVRLNRKLVDLHLQEKDQ